MGQVREVLIVGGGIAGMSLAVCLRRLGVRVDLIDSDEQGRAIGAGLSLNGATLKAFQRVGVLERMSAEGHMHSAFELHLPSGQLLQRIQPPSHPGGAPAGGGILRPVLHQILADATRTAGARIRLGVRLDGLQQADNRIRTACTDGEKGEYDLVIGADGLHSQVRGMIFPDAPQPRFTGQGCWRAVFPRPPDFDCVSIYMDTHHKAGLNPVSAQEMYLFLLETVDPTQRMPEEHLPRLLSERLRPFGSPLSELRSALDTAARINYRPLETLFLPAPWFKGNVLLIGDAAHATTPHSAYGCGLAVEDAVVLAELIEESVPLPQVLARFMERRFERCRTVVEGSVKLGDLEMAHAPLSEHQAVSAIVAQAIAQPI